MLMMMTTMNTMPSTTKLLILVSCCIMGIVTCANTVQTLQPDEFRERILVGDFDAIVDVRRRSDEWDLGHIPQATLVENLALFSSENSNTNGGTPSDLAGCEYCDIIVYCRSGSRAGQAITILRENGFKGRLYNALGVSQWTGDPYNYELVKTDSVVPPCTVNQTVSDQCYNEWVARNSIATFDSTNDGETDTDTKGEENGMPDSGKTNSPYVSSSGNRNMIDFPWVILVGGFCCLIFT